MNRALIVLLAGIFLMTGICFAAENRAALQAITSEAQRGLVEATVTPQLGVANANVVEIVRAAMTQHGVPAAQAEQVLATLSTPQHGIQGAWSGISLEDPAKARIMAPANIAQEITAAEVRTTNAPLVQAIATQLGVAPDQVQVSAIRVVSQETMDRENIHGPVIIRQANQPDVIVIGEHDYKTLTGPLQSRWAHEFAELTAIAQGKDEAAAHQVGLQVEAAVRAQRVAAGDEMERAAEIAEGNADRTWQLLGMIPAGVTAITIEATPELQGRPEMQAIRTYFRGRNIEVTVTPMAAPAGATNGMRVTMRDASGQTVGRQVERHINGELRRVNGIVNEGLLDALLPTLAANADEPTATAWAKANENTLRLLTEQRLANIQGLATAADTQKMITAAQGNPRLWPQTLGNLVTLALPAPHAEDISAQTEQEMVRQIFGRMA
ncbi:MAG: hypothetical protein WCG78_03380 [Candidatus Omnitrophota bacterium]